MYLCITNALASPSTIDCIYTHGEKHLRDSLHTERKAPSGRSRRKGLMRRCCCSASIAREELEASMRSERSVWVAIVRPAWFGEDKEQSFDVEPARVTSDT